ncbi:MAG: HAD family hydrolase [Cyclobacteriaceae bacterium]
MLLNTTKNLIFDLGGVIIDLDTSLSFQALSSFCLGTSSGEQLLSENVKLFLDYEKGLISSDDFRQGIRQLTTNEALSDEEIDEAWNRMLLHIPEERFKLLETLRQKYRLFVLSNTNAIHVTAFNHIVEKTSGKPDLTHFFDKVYFSHEIRLRKPEPEIYEYVLQNSGLKAEESLFIDDRFENIEAARALGMQVFHVTPEQNILHFFAGE